MATFLIFVTRPAHDSAAANTTFQFCTAALQADHAITAVFFYGAGVTHANKFLLPQAGEPIMGQLWSTLASKKIPLLVCATAANRRGIIDVTEAKQNQFAESSLHPRFTPSGLTEFAVLSQKVTRVVQF